MAKRPKQPKKAKKLYEPNRILELREERGWSQEDLAEKLEICAHLKTTAAQIGKLERRERQLTIKWLMALARTLDVDPIDLVDLAAMAGTTNDVEPQEGGPHATALAQRGLRYYNIVSDVCAEGGYPKGKTILVDQSPAAIAKRQSGDLVIVETRSGKTDSMLLLRFYMAPGLLVTNKPTGNTAMKIGKNKILAVVVRENHINA